MYVRVYLKSIADFLTLFRFSIGGFFTYLGLYRGKDAFPSVIVLLLLGWLSDVLDGSLARASKVSYKTWVGEHDFQVDIVFSFGLLMYLVLSGFISFLLIFVYLISAFLEIRSFPEGERVNAFLAIPYAFAIYDAFKYALPYGIMTIIFLFLLLLFTWNRFINEKFPRFIEEVKSIWKK
ncbi:MAG: hypothetical protein ACPLKX_01145 [Dictyoglomaceae bacterium]